MTIYDLTIAYGVLIPCDSVCLILCAMLLVFESIWCSKRLINVSSLYFAVPLSRNKYHMAVRLSERVP